MNIMVYVRQVLSAGELVEIDRANNRVDVSGRKFQPHPVDEAAVEDAVRLKESVADGSSGAARVTVVCIGPERTERDLNAYLAVGADDAIRVWDDSLAQIRLDDGAVATLLTEVEKKVSPGLIICGDDVSTALAAFLSESLQRPAATGVRAFELDGPGFRVKRKLEKSTATVVVATPGILAVERGHTPRYPSHRDRLMAKRKTITVLGSNDMAEAIQEVIDAGATLEIDAITLPKPGKKNYPTAGDGFKRYVDMLLGGVAGGDSGNQVVENSTERMAEIAVEKIAAMGCL